jgi:hypothetical protein
MALATDISWYRGEDILINVSMTPAMDITGWTIAFNVRQNYGDPGSPLITKSTSGGQIALTNAPGGFFAVTINSADTSSLAPRGYVYDISRIDSGSESVLCVGNLFLRPGVRI